MRGALLEHLGEGHGPLEHGAALEVLREKGVIEGLLSRIPADLVKQAAARRSEPAVGAAAGTSAGSTRLMVRVVRGVGFVGQLGRSSPALEEDRDMEVVAVSEEHLKSMAEFVKDTKVCTG